MVWKKKKNKGRSPVRILSFTSLSVFKVKEDSKNFFFYVTHVYWASLVAQSVKNLPAMQETQVRFLDQEDPLKKWQPTPVFLPGESQGQRRLAGYSSRGRKSRTQLSD